MEWGEAWVIKYRTPVANPNPFTCGTCETALALAGKVGGLLQLILAMKELLAKPLMEMAYSQYVLLWGSERLANVRDEHL